MLTVSLSLSLSLPVIPHYSVNMHWPWLLHDAKCIEIWKAGGWINEIQHTDVHKLYVSLYYIYIRIHTHVAFLQLVPATAIGVTGSDPPIFHFFDEDPRLLQLTSFVLGCYLLFG